MTTQVQSEVVAPSRKAAYSALIMSAMQSLAAIALEDNPSAEAQQDAKTKLAGLRVVLEARLTDDLTPAAVVGIAGQYVLEQVAEAEDPQELATGLRLLALFVQLLENLAQV